MTATTLNPAWSVIWQKKRMWLYSERTRLEVYFHYHQALIEFKGKGCWNLGEPK